MLEIYAWLSSRNDDSHHMRESARGWIAFGGALAILTEWRAADRTGALVWPNRQLYGHPSGGTAMSRAPSRRGAGGGRLRVDIRCGVIARRQVSSSVLPLLKARQAS